MLAGKYRVDAVLGAGGMGIVLAATHVHLRQRVAIKLLNPATAARRGSVERFLREARVAMSMRGEHVVRIFDVGTLDDGSPFIAMECLEGRDLGAVLDASAPLEPAVAVDYIL
jgi:eukaryotic-like serine/threonine-protein kinase